MKEREQNLLAKQISVCDKVFSTNLATGMHQGA